MVLCNTELLFPYFHGDKLYNTATCYFASISEFAPRKGQGRHPGSFVPCLREILRARYASFVNAPYTRLPT